MKNSRYGVLIADPPWQYRNAGGNGAAENHYATMSTPDICAEPVPYLAARDAVLYLWATWPMLPDALRVINAWGFTYKTGLPWVKTQGEPAVNLWGDLDYRPAMGTGFWVRGCSEPLLIAVRGRVAVPEGADRYLGLLAPRATHSRKPDHIYQLAERHPGPYLEYYGKRRWPGWDVYGDEVEGSILLPPGILRIQRFRGVKDWRKPEGAISVTRHASKRGCPVGTPNYWGNEYRMMEDGGTYTRDEAIALYRRDVVALPEVHRREWLAPLHSAMYLMCYCSLDEPCHADVLLDFLNASA